MLELAGEEAGIAEVFLESRSEHLADLIREIIEPIEQAPKELMVLVTDDWVLYDRD